MSMTANKYQELALRTANDTLDPMQQLQNGLMGLCGESGEALDILKKHLFQGHPFTDETITHIKKELGDVAWYLAISAAALGYSLEEVMRDNIAKLEARYPELCFKADRSLNRREGDI